MQLQNPNNGQSQILGDDGELSGDVSGSRGLTGNGGGSNGDGAPSTVESKKEEEVAGYELRSLVMNLLISVGLGLLVGILGGIFHNVVHSAQVWTRTHLHNMYTYPWNENAEDSRDQY